jgi:DNA-binding NarL/FixJ family response regulator
MDKRRILVVSDEGSQPYWLELKAMLSAQIGPVRILLDRDAPRARLRGKFDLIVMDISDIESLHTLIRRYLKLQPGARLLTVTTTPTWKQTRDVLKLGAASVIRKSADPQEMLQDLQSG